MAILFRALVCDHGTHLEILHQVGGAIVISNTDFEGRRTPAGRIGTDLIASAQLAGVGFSQLRTRTFRTFMYATAPTLESRGNLHDGKADLLTRAAVAGHRLWIRFTVGAAAI